MFTNKCSTESVKWIVDLQSELEVSVVGTEAECGMVYEIRNKMANRWNQNAPHPAEAVDYYWHGTMRPTYPGDEIFFVDSWEWQNTEGGTTILMVSGSSIWARRRQ